MLKYAESPRLEADYGIKQDIIPVSPVTAYPPATILEIDKLSREYVFQDYRTVSQFLCESPHLVNDLNQSLAPVREIFGVHAVINLNVSHDPDSDIDSRFIYARIQSPKPLEESVALLDQFERQWCIRQDVSQSGDLVFDVDIKA